jgi:hypothetical protein
VEGLRKPILGDVTACCARAASSQAAADPAITVMKSRRRIALPKAGTTPTWTQLQQGFAAAGMGSARYFAWQQSSGPNVRFGSKADIGSASVDVRFTPESGHCEVCRECPLRANSGLMQCNNSITGSQ